MTFEQIASLEAALRVFLETFRGCFKREKTFGYWLKYIVGLMADVKRKSIEPIALAAGVPVRTLQEFLAFFVWDDRLVDNRLQRLVADEHSCATAIGVLDASGHGKQGDKTPGVQRQWCGETGKVDNCVVGQHLLYTDNDASNPFTCVVGSDLYLPKSWSEDRERCREAGIPDELLFRPKWRIGIEQIERAMGNGIRFDYVTFDEDYGKVPEFWFELDRLGQRAIGEVPKNFLCWATPPACRSSRAEHAAKRADNLARHSPDLRDQRWRRFRIKDGTRGPVVWEVKAARVQLAITHMEDGGPSVPTDRRYWLIVSRHPQTGEIKYFVSNAPSKTSLLNLLRVAFARWHIEKWFERAKQETGFGSFEVRTYTSLLRHWLSSRMAMFFLARQTRRLRGEKSADHVGASGRCGQYLELEDMEQIPAFMDGQSRPVCLLPGT